MPPRQMTDVQLTAMLRAIAKTYLEVERGLRPPGHLQPLLTPPEYRRQRAEPRPDRPLLGPIRMQEDMGPIHFDREGNHCVRATLVARRGNDQWGSLVIELRGTDDGWLVSHIERLERAVDLPEPNDTELPDSNELLARRIATTELERSLVGAAMTAIARRIEDIGDRRTKASRLLSEQLDGWADRLSELDEELEMLARRRELLAPDLPDHDGERRLTCDVEELLGSRPQESHHAVTWDRLAADVQTYRVRWGVADGDPPLGAPPEDEDQKAQRRELTKRICELRRKVVEEVERDTATERAAPMRPDFGPEI